MYADTALAAVESPSAPPPRLVPSVRAALRVRRYSLKTERAYVHYASGAISMKANSGLPVQQRSSHRRDFNTRNSSRTSFRCFFACLV